MTHDRRATPDVETKALGPLEIKDEAQGLVEAVVASLNCVDHDGDVILPGAIPNGSTVKLSSYGHDVVLHRAAPVGIGTITERGDKAILQGRFFLNTQRGREAFETVKALGADGEWSIGFRPSKEPGLPSDEWKAKGARRMLSKLALVECSPVFEGASLATGTIGTKDADEEAQKAKADADAATAQKAADDAAVIETKRLADEAEQKAHVAVAVEEYERRQRYFRKMGVLG